MATKKDYYEVLAVSKTANADEIKKAYRKLAVKYHPDKNPGDKSAEESFKEVGEAYEILSDDQKRAAYDRYGHSAFSQGAGPGAGGFHDPFEMFRDAFSGNGGSSFFESFFGGTSSSGRGASRSGPQQGEDLRDDIEVTLEEVLHGTEKEITYDRLAHCEVCDGTGSKDKSKPVTCKTCGGVGQVLSSRGLFQVQQTCPSCKGTGVKITNPCTSCHGKGLKNKRSTIRASIPAGIETGSRIRLRGKGNDGMRKGPAGDLYLFVEVAEHELFSREHNDLLCQMPIPFVKAALGGEITVPTLEGKASLKIPEGTQSDTTFRLRNKGLPTLNNTKQVGDLYVRVKIAVPNKLKADEREALESFASLNEKNISAAEDSFFAKAKKFFA
jgi:molecular chaperone DnaJ